jgi:hypothetical protein
VLSKFLHTKPLSKPSKASSEPLSEPPESSRESRQATSEPLSEPSESSSEPSEPRSSPRTSRHADFSIRSSIKLSHALIIFLNTLSSSYISGYFSNDIFLRVYHLKDGVRFRLADGRTVHSHLRFPVMALSSAPLCT